VGVQTRSREEREERAKVEGAADTALSASAVTKVAQASGHTLLSGRLGAPIVSLSTAQLHSEHFSDRINEPHVA
jgi:hypothetical protein